MTGQVGQPGNIEKPEFKEKTSNLSETAEFVNRISKEYIYPELREEVADNQPVPDEQNLTTDTDELDRTS